MLGLGWEGDSAMIGVRLISVDLMNKVEWTGSSNGDLTGHLIYQSRHMLVSRDSNPRYPGSNGETLPSSLKSLHC